MTEKFFHIFNRRYNVIPVVYNGADMASIAPPHSYINVRDYGTVQELADYLQLVNSNDTLFASYFWWRDYYTFRVSINIKYKSKIYKTIQGQDWQCQLCNYLHSDLKKERQGDVEKLVSVDKCEVIK